MSASLTLVIVMAVLVFMCRAAGVFGRETGEVTR